MEARCGTIYAYLRLEAYAITPSPVFVGFVYVAQSLVFCVLCLFSCVAMAL